MEWFNSCCPTACGESCASVACGDCSSGCCCPDCFGAGSFFDGIKEWIENNVTIVGGSDYVLPTASKTVKGGLKVDHSLMMTDESLNVAPDTVPSTVEGFLWINDIVESVEGGGGFTAEDVDDIFS